MNPVDTQKIKEEAVKRFDNLPQDVKDAMMSVSTSEIIYETGRKHGLNIEKTGALAEQVGYVMLGMLPARDFIRDLVKILGIDTKTAQGVAADINSRLFMPIRDNLKKIHGVSFNDDVAKEPPVMPKKQTSPGQEPAIVFPPSASASSKPPPAATPPLSQQQKIVAPGVLHIGDFSGNQSKQPGAVPPPPTLSGGQKPTTPPAIPASGSALITPKPPIPVAPVSQQQKEVAPGALHIGDFFAPNTTKPIPAEAPMSKPASAETPAGKPTVATPPTTLPITPATEQKPIATPATPPIGQIPPTSGPTSASMPPYNPFASMGQGRPPSPGQFPPTLPSTKDHASEDTKKVPAPTFVEASADAKALADKSVGKPAPISLPVENKTGSAAPKIPAPATALGVKTEIPKTDKPVAGDLSKILGQKDEKTLGDRIRERGGYKADPYREPIE